MPVADDYRGEEVKVYLMLRECVSPEGIAPDQVIDYCKTCLAVIKLPRFIVYVTEFPYTPSEKVAKHKLVAQCENFRANSWDAEVAGWLNANGDYHCCFMALLYHLNCGRQNLVDSWCGESQVGLPLIAQCPIQLPG